MPINATLNATSPYGFPAPQNDASLAVIFIIVGVVLTYRVYRSTRGTRFSTRSVYRLPVYYLLITAMSLFLLNPSYVEIAIAAFSVAAGLLLGLRLAGGVLFFEKDNQVYYKRSPLVMIIWLASFVARFAVDILYSGVPAVVLAVTFVLAGTTGLIIGEAVHIKRNYEAYRKEVKAPEQ